MQSAFSPPLQPGRSEYNLTLSNQQIFVQSQVQIEQISNDKQVNEDNTHIIQNYYCLQRGGYLIKVTLIKIGRQVLRLTDKIMIKKEPFSEEDDKTKCSANNSPLEMRSQKQKNSKSSHLSKIAKDLLKTFEDWIKRNNPQDFKYIIGISQYSNESQVVNSFAYNSVLRQIFLNFIYWFIKQKPQLRIAKVANQWMKRCLAARQEQRMKEEYIEQVLEKM